jgi:hypothetical protein
MASISQVNSTQILSQEVSIHWVLVLYRAMKIYENQNFIDRSEMIWVEFNWLGFHQHHVAHIFAQLTKFATYAKSTGFNFLKALTSVISAPVSPFLVVVDFWFKQNTCAAHGRCRQNVFYLFISCFRAFYLQILNLFLELTFWITRITYRSVV